MPFISCKEKKLKEKLELIVGDITMLEVDAIVNAANSTLLGGGGVDGAIHRAAGKDLLEECRGLGGCLTGEAKITKGYQLKASYVIHTVGPVWKGGNEKEKELLQNCYQSALKLCLKNKIRTVAFPAISTGIYGYPKEEACKVAIKTTYNFFNNKDSIGIKKVVFCCFDKLTLEIYKKEIDFL
ncbi:MAG: O-acetyl-ADP-ribose deacetylase [Halobacteriovoraceae bacterium]|nr:O-acetyl-ADP-ribose deacetylase [Halobacteriovoraceae bacterium]|tara:strand:- start:76 stop:624 length:549 start_codon:yes stop_codon:yes gene_type:complete